MKHSYTYSSLFALKALCVVLVVLIHTTLPGQEFMIPLARVGVVIFFMISGYFTYADDSRKVTKRLLKSIRKISWMILYANVVYILLKIGLHTFDPHVELPLTTLKDWVLLVFFGSGVILPFWYLTAYLETLLVFLVAVKLRREHLLLLAVPLLVATNLAIGMYGFVWNAGEIPYSLKVNFLMNGIPFFCIGYIIHKHRARIMAAITPVQAEWITAGIFTLAYCEAALLRFYAGEIDLDYTNNLYLMTLPLAVALFVWCLLHPDAGKNSWLERWGKHYTMDIYLWHYLFFLIFFTCFRTPFIARYSFLVILPCTLVSVWLLHRARDYYHLLAHRREHE